MCGENVECPDPRSPIWTASASSDTEPHRQIQGDEEADRQTNKRSDTEQVVWKPRRQLKTELAMVTVGRNGPDGDITRRSLVESIFNHSPVATTDTSEPELAAAAAV